jgi:hypothetical protein
MLCADPKCPAGIFLLYAVLGIRDILMRILIPGFVSMIQLRIRLLFSVTLRRHIMRKGKDPDPEPDPLTNRSGSGRP